MKLKVQIFLLLTLTGDKAKKESDFYYLFKKEQEINAPMVFPGMFLYLPFFLKDSPGVYEIIAIECSPKDPLKIYIRDKGQKKSYLGMGNEEGQKEYIYGGWKLNVFSTELDEIWEYDRSYIPYKIIHLLVQKDK